MKPNSATDEALPSDGLGQLAPESSAPIDIRFGSEADVRLNSDVCRTCASLHWLTRIGNERLKLHENCFWAAVFSGVHQSGYTFGTT